MSPILFVFLSSSGYSRHHGLVSNASERHWNENVTWCWSRQESGNCLIFNDSSSPGLISSLADVSKYTDTSMSSLRGRRLYYTINAGMNHLHLTRQLSCTDMLYCSRRPSHFLVRRSINAFLYLNPFLKKIWPSALVMTKG